MAKKGCLKTLFNFFIIVAIIVTVVIYPQWYKKQWNKVMGMYYVAKGDTALRKASFQQAIDEYKHGLYLFPNHYGAWYNLGNIYVTYEDYYSAADAYTNAIKYNPNYVLARMNYGIISAEKLGDFDEAIKQYNYIINMKKNKLAYWLFVINNLQSYKTYMGLAYYNKGVAYRQKSTYIENRPEDSKIYIQEAIKAYKEAVKILRNDYDAQYNLALSYQLNGDYNLAGLAYCRAIELAPMNYEAHYNLAVLLNHLRYYKEALKEMNKANTIISSNGESYNQSRYVYDILSDVTRSILKEDDGLKFMKEEVWSNNNLQHYSEKDDSQEGINKEIINNFRICSAKSIFRDEEHPQEDLSEPIDIP